MINIRNCFVLLVVFFVIICPYCAVCADCNKPLNCGDIEYLLTNGVSNERIIQLINECGVDCILTKEIINKIKGIGANNSLIEVIRKKTGGDKKPQPSPIPPPERAPKNTGQVSIMSYPKGIVFINKKEAGYTPLKNVEVPVGRNEISVRVDGEVQKKIIIVRENETAEISFQFEKVD